jgi:hypothetical protein
VKTLEIGTQEQEGLVHKAALVAIAAGAVALQGNINEHAN